MADEIDLPNKDWPEPAGGGDLAKAIGYADEARISLEGAVAFCDDSSEEFVALRDILEEAHSRTRAVLGRFLVLEKEGHL